MHKCFDVICGRRCPAVAEHAVAFRGNQHVVFDAYSTETEILANFGKIDEASAETFLFPFFDQRRDEVDARFYGHYHAWSEALAHAER